MNVAKDYCDCIISWEVQENRKISSVVHCSYSQPKIDKRNSSDGMCTNSKMLDETEVDFSPVLLTPFLHPELTKASYCDLKIFVSPKLGVKLDRLTIVSTAKMTEFYDRNGEMTFSTKGERILAKVERGKDDSSDKIIVSGSSKIQNQKSSLRWFINDYIPSNDTFEVMARCCDQFVSNQLHIKYIGVKILAHDWSAELGSYNLTTPVGPNTSGHIGSTGSICSNTVTFNCDKITEAIQNVNNAVQVLANEVGCAHKGSNPHLSTISSLDTTALFKHRRPNSPMTSGTGSPSTNYWTGISTRRSSDISNLQLWLETRLTAIELTIVKGLEQLSSRISQLENKLESHNEAVEVLESNGNPPVSLSSSVDKGDLNLKSSEPTNERNSSCQRF